MIEKAVFVDAIEAMRLQYFEDKKNKDFFCEAFSIAEFAIFDNSKLYLQIIDLLCLWFDRDDLVHYCFELDFGRIGENVETSEQFYERLIGNIIFFNN